MAACMGAFGSYKLQYSRYLKEREDREREKSSLGETVWVTKRYAPTDERVIAPVPRHKHVVQNKLAKLPPNEVHWIPVSDPPLSSFNRTRLPAGLFYVSQPATRCEEWSTLRQMLPTYTNIRKVKQPNWGTTSGPPPLSMNRLGTRLPHVNSCMTNYVDEMHKTNRQFKLC